MNKRALTLGLLIAILAGFIVQAMQHGHKAIVSDMALYIPYFLSPLFGMMIQATSMLAWAVPGVYVGYLCKHKPAQHGAILGAIYGTILGLIIFAFKFSELRSADGQAIFAVVSLTEIIKYSALFALTAPAGYLFAKYRANL